MSSKKSLMLRPSTSMFVYLSRVSARLSPDSCCCSKELSGEAKSIVWPFTIKDDSDVGNYSSCSRLDLMKFLHPSFLRYSLVAESEGLCERTGEHLAYSASL